MTAPELDDPAGLASADPGGMLLAAAGGAAQVREAAGLAEEAGIARLAEEGRPRAVVVCGAGTSATAGDVLAAVAGLACPVPVVVHRTAGLPAWVGAADLVVAVSASGRTPETLSALTEAVRRGSRLLVVGAARSPLAELGDRGRGVVVPVTQGRTARASIWSLSVPLVVAAAAMRLLPPDAADVDGVAQVLEQVATRCRPDAETALNPGKLLASELQGTVPVVWGASPLAGTAAHRFASRLGADAARPAVWGVLPEAAHDQIGLLDGARPGGGGSDDDFFRDREDDPDAPPLRLVLLREPGELPQVAAQADACAQIAEQRGAAVSVVRAEGGSALARLASLVAVADFASTYLALAEGLDPTPVAASRDLEQRTAER